MGKKKGPKPDDRSDNVERLREQVVNTIENLEEAHETLQMNLPEEQKEAIRAKNRRREQASAAKREEIRDEYALQQEQKE